MTNDRYSVPCAPAFAPALAPTHFAGDSVLAINDMDVSTAELEDAMAELTQQVVRLLVIRIVPFDTEGGVHLLPKPRSR